MIEELNKQLAAVQEKRRLRKKLRTRLSRSQEDLNRETERLGGLEHAFDQEDSDVRRLEGLSLTGLFATILGSKEEQLKKERQERLAVRLRVAECKFSIASIEREIIGLQEQIAQLGDLDSQYEAILDRKASLIDKVGDETAEGLLRLTEAAANKQADLRELQEATQAGEKVREKLSELIASLESAGSWGVWDLIGGGLITTAIKHSRIDEARASIHQVQQLLRRFQRELDDVDALPGIGLEIDIGSFATFADYVFDGLISDWVVQSRVQDALARTVHTDARVCKIVQVLSKSVHERTAEVDRLTEERRRLLESG